MAKLIIRNENGDEIVISDNVGEDIVAVKIFSLGNIQGLLKDKGFEGTKDEAEAVIKSSPHLKENLQDMNDTDWKNIKEAVELAKSEGVIHFHRDLERLLEKNGCEMITCSHCSHLCEEDYCFHYGGKVNTEDGSDCTHFCSDEYNAVVLCYMGETIELPVLHTDPGIPLQKDDMICIAKQIPSVAKDVQQMIGWYEEDKNDGESEEICLHEERV